MKIYKCDVCNKEITLSNVSTRITTVVRDFEVDICPSCKKIVDERINIYVQDRMKKDQEFCDNLFKEDKK